MTDDRWTRAKQILNDLLDVDPDDRASWLDERCGDDSALRAEVESLLDAHDQGPLSSGAQAADWIEDEARGPSLPIGLGRPETGTHLDGYRLLEEIGVGGMGVVYRAERTDTDFEQTVAVKLLQRRLHADDAEQRFRAERQVLATLDHPNVARLLDGGVTEGGRPYLVMEHVDGRPITEYVTANDLGLEARLDLLRQVMEAVQAAHRRLVVHRDLKPSNVLVTEAEAGPQVKLLDFGIAKLLDDSLPVTRPETRTGRHLMTPSYAAPEQVTGGEVTTATDTYQIGVLAYELLAGVRPYDLDDKSLTEIERLVVETDPSPPSEQASGQGIAPEQLRGDLDVIVAKALRREPERRYSSVEALMTDLRRYRAGEPIEARPATLGYRTRKFLQRHRWGVGVATAFLIVLSVAGTMLVRQRDRARREARKAERVSSFLTNLFGAAIPSQAQGDTITARELMREGRKRLDELKDQPAVQAQMMYVLGRTHRKLALYDEARRLLKKSLVRRQEVYGETHPEVAESMMQFALFLRDQGDYAMADSLLHRVVDLRRRLKGPRHPSVAAALMDRTYVLRQLGKPETAETTIRQAISIQRAHHGRPSMELTEGLFNLAGVLRDQEKYERARTVQRRSLAMARKLTDGPHPSVALNLNNLALVLRKQENFRAADSIQRKALKKSRALYGPEHPEVAAALGNLALVVFERGRFEEADSLYREALRLNRTNYGTNHLDYGTELAGLGDVYRAQGRYQEADSLYRTALDIFRSNYEEPHPNTANTLWDLGALKLKQDSLNAAQTYLKRALALQRSVRDRPSVALQNTLTQLAKVYRKQGRHDRAIERLREARAKIRAAEGHEQQRIVELNHALGESLMHRGQYAAAESLLTRSYHTYQTLKKRPPGTLKDVYRSLYRIYEKRETPQSERLPPPDSADGDHTIAEQQ